MGARPGEPSDDSWTDQAQGQGRGQGPAPQGPGRQRDHARTGRGHTAGEGDSTGEGVSSERDGGVLGGIEGEGDDAEGGAGEGEDEEGGGEEGEDEDEEEEEEEEEDDDMGLLAWQLADATGCCSVCLGELEAGEELRLLPGCGHVFHKECVDRCVGGCRGVRSGGFRWRRRHRDQQALTLDRQ